MDVLETLYPDRQLVIEVDHSAGHAKYREDGLHVGNMNVRFGGKQRELRDTIMAEGCLGPEEAKMYLNRGAWSTQVIEGITARTGYVGKAKGRKQVFWDRGWFVDGMSTAATAAPEMNIDTFFGNLPDFKNERPALQHLVESRGDILLLSPKFHPELAGVGIVY
ncbi:unnamed protein product, partial [Laminaria digitata]